MRKIIIYFAFFLAILLGGVFLLAEENNWFAANRPEFLKEKSNQPEINKNEGKEKTIAKTGCVPESSGLDCRVTKYLEEKLSITSKGGLTFCSYEILGPQEKRHILHLYTLCQEFYLYEGKIYEGSGLSTPIVLTESKEGNFSYWKPRDGSYFYKDVKEKFPPEILPKISNFSITNYEKLELMNIEKAKDHFGADFNYEVEKILEQNCIKDYDCSTPGEYLVLSRCRFSSKCLEGKCAVICTHYQLLPFY